MDIVLLALFGYIAIVSVWILLWQMAGSELIGFSNQTLTSSQRILGFQRSKEYITEHIVNLRVTPPNSTRPMRGFFAEYSHLFGVEDGALTFDYGTSRVHLAASLNELEARKLILEIQRRLPRYHNTVQ
jgi:hypothetical protein